jgi:hypothetical protein
MLKYASAFAAFALLATGAQAQTAAPVDPQRLAVAKQIFEAQGGAQNAATAMRAIEKSMIDSSPSPEVRERMAQVMETMTKTFLPRMFDEMATIYATDFTDAQLKDILAFYASPTGQALKEKGPLVAQQLGGVMVKLMPQLQLSVLDKVCAQTTCTPQQQQQLATLKQAVPASDRF